MKQFLIISILALLVASCSGDQPERLGIHFLRETNWTGEPAGLVYHEGTYHLFYQCNPTEPFSGNISWGHAVSHDLTSWEERPIAIQAEAGEQVFAGSVVVDIRNTSGLSTDGKPLFIAYYTRYQAYTVGMAISRDEGVTWQKVEPMWTEKETVLMRNPNVAWNEVLGCWLMTVSTGQAIRFYTSADALRWTYLSAFGEGMEVTGAWEASTFTSFITEGSGETKWVLMISMYGGPSDGAPGIRYFIGDLNDSGFEATQAKELWADYGKDYYNGILCNNMPNNRKVMISWMNCWWYANLTPETGQRGRMAYPRELALVCDGNHYMLRSKPVDELSTCYGEAYTMERMEITHVHRLFDKQSFPDPPFVLDLAFDASNRFAMRQPREYGIRFLTASGRALTLAYRAEMNYYYIDRAGLGSTVFSDDFEQLIGAAYHVNSPVDRWTILFDKGSVELFTGNDKVALSSLWFSDEPFNALEVYAESGKINILGASLIRIK